MAQITGAPVERRLIEQGPKGDTGPQGPAAKPLSRAILLGLMREVVKESIEALRCTPLMGFLCGIVEFYARG